MDIHARKSKQDVSQYLRGKESLSRLSIKQFSVAPAYQGDQELREAFRRLRIKTFVEQLGYETEKSERDMWDNDDMGSICLTLLYRPDLSMPDFQVVGGCRLLKAKKGYKLPIQEREEYHKGGTRSHYKELEQYNGEISRLIFPRMTIKDERCRCSIRLMLFVALGWLMFEEGILWGYASVQTSLLRQLNLYFPDSPEIFQSFGSSWRQKGINKKSPTQYHAMKFSIARWVEVIQKKYPLV